MLERVAKSLRRCISFQGVVGLYRRRLSRKIFKQCHGTIKHGPFAGMRLLDNPRERPDQGVRILGLYGQEVVKALVEAPACYRVFVAIGAADGYYAVGMLFSRRVGRSVAFESRPEYRTAIARLAAANDIADGIKVLGSAGDDFVSVLRYHGIHSTETMFLIDTEGAEFKLLTDELFVFLKDSMILVETHARSYADPKAEMEGLIKRASRTHRATILYPGARNPWKIEELANLEETDRWILCSEGRSEMCPWLRFDPR